MHAGDRQNQSAFGPRLPAILNFDRSSSAVADAARGGLGPDVELMIDAHGSLEVAPAIKLARQLGRASALPCGRMRWSTSGMSTGPSFIASSVDQQLGPPAPGQVTS